MNRKLIVTLLKKDIQELDMITDGFMEMNVYPAAITNLAKRKVSDIQMYIHQLEDVSKTPMDEIKESIDDDISIEDSVSIDIEHQSSEIIEPEIIEPEFVEDVSVSVEDDFVEDEPICETEEALEALAETEEDTSVIELVECVSDKTNDNVEPDVVIPTLEVVEINETSDLISSTKIIVEDTKKTILAEKLSSHIPSRNDSLSKVDNSISSSLANKKIVDIKQAINIGDRFRFQRELFRGNGEEMNKTLSYINQLATFEEVHSFVSAKYGWEKENDTVDDFYQIVKRRFI